MSLISTLTSSSSSMSGLTSTTSSAIALSQVLTCATIAIGALIVLLALNELMSRSDSWNAKTAAALQILYLPLIVTLCACVVFKAAQAL